MSLSQDLSPAKATLLIFLQQKFYECVYSDQVVLGCPYIAPIPVTDSQQRDMDYARRLKRQLIPVKLREKAISLEKVAIEAKEARAKYKENTAI